MTISIEPITEDHIGSFHHALDIVSRERKYLAFLEAPPLEVTREFVRNNIANGYPQLVVLAGGEVVGWCDVIPKSRPVHAHAGDLGMGLLPSLRGRGIGRALISRTITAAHEFGLIRIELHVQASNKNAIRLYESVGFLHEGTKKDAFFVDGRYEDVHMMARVDHNHQQAQTETNEGT